MTLERWTNSEPQRRTRSSRCGLPPCRGESAGVAERPRERSPAPKCLTLRFAPFSVGVEHAEQARDERRAFERELAAAVLRACASCDDAKGALLHAGAGHVLPRLLHLPPTVAAAAAAAAGLDAAARRHAAAALHNLARYTHAAPWQVRGVEAESSLGDAESSLGDVKSSLG
jgi:hypothetical protein